MLLAQLFSELVRVTLERPMKVLVRELEKVLVSAGSIPEPDWISRQT